MSKWSRPNEVRQSWLESKDAGQLRTLAGRLATAARAELGEEYDAMRQSALDMAGVLRAARGEKGPTELLENVKAFFSMRYASLPCDGCGGKGTRTLNGYHTRPCSWCDGTGYGNGVGLMRRHEDAQKALSGEAKAMVAKALDKPATGQQEAPQVNPLEERVKRLEEQVAALQALVPTFAKSRRRRKPEVPYDAGVRAAAVTDVMDGHF